MNREPEDDFYQDDFNPICKKCDCETYFVECATCGGEGDIDGEEEDPLWYAPGEYIKCGACNGKGGWYVCKCENEMPTI